MSTTSARRVVALIAAASVAIVPAAGARTTAAKRSASKPRTIIVCVKAQTAKSRKQTTADARSNFRSRALMPTRTKVIVTFKRTKKGTVRVVRRICARPNLTTQSHRVPQDAASAQAPPAAGSGLAVGLVGNTQAWGNGMGARMDAETSNGVKWLREEFDWNVIEPSDGQWDFSRYDTLMTEAALRGIHILPIAISTPGWAGATWDTIPGDTGPYADFVAHIAGRYGAGGSFWTQHPDLTPAPVEWVELWNEPFLPQFSNGDPDPGRYAHMVAAATDAGRAANPNVKYLMALDSSAIDSSGNERDWLGAMYDAVPDLNDHFDGVTVHPYGNGGLRIKTRGASRWQFRRLEDIRAAMVARGAADKPFWLTEMGWTTCPAGSDARCDNEQQQADYITELFSLLRTDYSSYVRGVFLYRYDDLKPGGDSDREAYFGLKHADGTPKPAWDALTRAIAAT